MVSSATLTIFLEGAALGLAAAAAPGPLQAYLLAQSARNGAARTLPVVLVPLVTDPPLIAVVLAALAQVPAGFLRALGIGGGAVVLWLGVAALRAAQGPAAADPARPRPVGFVRGLLVNITNPNAWLWWSARRRTNPRRGVAELAPPRGRVPRRLLPPARRRERRLRAPREPRRRAGPQAARALGALSGAALVAFGAWRVAGGLAGAW